MPGHVPPTSLPQKAQRGDHPQPLRAFLPSISGVPAAGPLHTWHVLGCPAWLPHAVLPWPQEVSHPSVALSCRHRDHPCAQAGESTRGFVSPTGCARERTGRRDTRSGEGAQRHRLGAAPGPGHLLASSHHLLSWGPGFVPKKIHFPFIVVLGDARSRWGGVKRNTFLLCYSILSSISVGTAGKGLSQGGSAASKLGPGKL